MRFYAPNLCVCVFGINVARIIYTRANNHVQSVVTFAMRREREQHMCACINKCLVTLLLLLQHQAQTQIKYVDDFIANKMQINPNKHVHTHTHSDSWRSAAYGSRTADRRENGTVAGQTQSGTAAAVLEATTLQYVNCDFLANEPAFEGKWVSWLSVVSFFGALRVGIA